MDGEMIKFRPPACTSDPFELGFPVFLCIESWRNVMIMVAFSLTNNTRVVFYCNISYSGMDKKP